MARKILFEGWDDLSSREQEAVQKWLKGILNAWFAKQEFLDLYCFRDCHDSLPLTTADLSLRNGLSDYDDYVFVSSTSEEKSILNIQDFIEKIIPGIVKPIILSELQECIGKCGNDIECRRDCRKKALDSEI